MNGNGFQKTLEGVAAFQKLWMESTFRMAQAAFSVPLGSAPPEALRQLRGGMFQALADSWEEYMRSPQFVEGMRQSMENAITFRKMTNDFMARFRNEMQSPSRDDIDTVMLTVRHMEKRLLDRIDETSAEIGQLREELANLKGSKGAEAAGKDPGAGSNTRRRTTGKTEAA